MKSLATILAVLVIQIVHAVEEEGDVNIIIQQNVVQPDVDECLEKIDACAENEICINMPGTYRCACVDGFEKVKGICKDVDECSENIDTCHDTKEVCVNRAGSFSCVCSDGFEKLEDICEDVDECLEKIYSCADNEICENMPGTYRCACADGFEKVTGICKDIDECIEEPCNIHGVCVNSPGSFTCTCNEGFENVEGICEDIDECIEMCGIHGVCVNSPGSFTCTCNEGFEEVEGICEDIDECKDNTTNSCGDNENEMCANTIGNYTCSCFEGYAKLYGTCTGCNIIIPAQYGENLCLVSTKAKYDDSVDYCSEIGGHILTSPGPDIVGLKKYVFNLNYRYNTWFDISYDEGNWVWANGDPITRSIYVSENGCVTFDSLGYFYYAKKCSYDVYIVCQHD